MKWPGAQPDFNVLETIHGDRAQKRRLRVIHTATGIQCTLQCDVNFELAESSQIIRDCVTYAPICKFWLERGNDTENGRTRFQFRSQSNPIGYHLIAYIRSWQDALNEAAAQKGLCAFRFNTYIISVLVIFFARVNQILPKLEAVPASHAKFLDHVPHIDRTQLKQAVGRFFAFYGTQYDVANLIISAHIGHLENRHDINQQTNLSPEQKRFVDINFLL